MENNCKEWGPVIHFASRKVLEMGKPNYATKEESKQRNTQQLAWNYPFVFIYLQDLVIKWAPHHH